MTARKQIGVRVDDELREAIDGQREFFPRADGARATRSEVLRAMLEEARVLFDPEVLRQVRALARAEGVAMADAWAAVIERGLVTRDSLRSGS